MKTALLICFSIVTQYSLCCDDCLSFVTTTNDSTSNVSLGYRQRSFNGYQSLGHRHHLFLTKSGYNNLKTTHHPAGFLVIDPSEKDYELSQTWMLSGNYFITKNTALSITIPYQKLTVYYNQATDLTKPLSDTTFEYSGIGDVNIGVQWGRLQTKRDLKYRFIKGFTAKLPTGKFRYTENGVDQSPVILEQTGTGSLDLNFRASYDILWKEKFLVKGLLSYKISTNKESNFRYGNRLLGVFDFGYLCRLNSLSLQIRSGMAYENYQADFFNSLEQENTAGKILYSNLSLIATYKTKTSFEFQGYFPVAQKTFDAAIGTAGVLQMRLSYFI